MFAFLILFCLIFLNGLFVMAEIALVSARKSKLEEMASKGDLKAKAALNLSENPELFLSTAQIGITLVATGTVPTQNGITNVASVVAHLKCNVPAAMALRTPLR